LVSGSVIVASASNAPCGAPSWPARNSTLREPAGIGHSLGCADSAQAHWQSNRKQDRHSSAQQLKKDFQYLQKRQEKLEKE